MQMPARTKMQPELPATIRVLERGWLSANNILLTDGDAASLIDTGYVGHVDQTLALVEQALAGRTLTQILNTHCHSDHMGGNARLAARFDCPITVPAGEAPLIERWDGHELILDYADQRADRFTYDGTFAAEDVLTLGGFAWRVIAAPGHDHHAVMFHCAETGVLISGDALWEDGFGILFAALQGDGQAFALAQATLENIAALRPRIVIPGHGRVFDQVEPALERAFSRLRYQQEDMTRLARYCAKALFLYALLERRAMAVSDVEPYLARVPVYGDLNRNFLRQSWPVFAGTLLDELVRSRAVTITDGRIAPAIRA